MTKQGGIEFISQELYDDYVRLQAIEKRIKTVQNAVKLAKDIPSMFNTIFNYFLEGTL